MVHSANSGLRPYLDFLPQGGVKKFAEAIGKSTVYLLQLAVRQGGREASPKLCVRIEMASKRAVRRWHLRPNDWHELWPELIGRKGAPRVPDPVEAAKAAKAAARARSKARKPARAVKPSRAAK